MWNKHGGGMSFDERVNYHRSLETQFPAPAARVVYSKAGSQPAAAIIRDAAAVIDHKLYWAAADEDEARYLESILNSETARAAVQHLQSRGQWGARDFDKVLLSLPIPVFDAVVPLHQELAAAAERAEQVAAGVDIPAGTYFVKARQMIRQALTDDGVFKQIDRLVGELLGKSLFVLHREAAALEVDAEPDEFEEEELDGEVTLT